MISKRQHIDEYKIQTGLADVALVVRAIVFAWDRIAHWHFRTFRAQTVVAAVVARQSMSGENLRSTIKNAVVNCSERFTERDLT